MSDLKSEREDEFPIKTKTACQLKWSHSTVYLTLDATASCHRVNHDVIPANFNFHNTPEKIEARNTMLRGEWPGNGCEHCEVIEASGGMSDRMLHSKFYGLGPPPELDYNPVATEVTPRWLEIYFSNLCNLSCIYCGEQFSSTWEAENIKFNDNYYEKNYNVTRSSEMFEWLDKNIQNIFNLMVLGGEPFTQPQTDELLTFLETRQCPELKLIFFSNLSIDSKHIKQRFNKMQSLKNNGNIKDIHVIGSIDCWGREVEYIRSGLDMRLFVENFEYLLYNTDSNLNINTCWTSLSTFTMPELIQQVNEWNEHRRVYYSLMQVGGKPHLHPNIFGSKVLDWGFRESYELFETYDDPELTGYKEYMLGIMKSIEQTEPNKKLQRELHEYLTMLDGRRNTNYKEIFPTIYKEIHGE